ncbi:MAG: hypothetical protein D6689_20530 [Deltaproteobacteria bacterium]|nr:MAG: hypothetical protein D6689_20530 [Deltaproteobacteria bacterium]
MRQLAALIAGGARDVARIWRVVAALYAVQVAAACAIGFATAMVVAHTAGVYPAVAAAARGDAYAALQVARTVGPALAGVVWAAVGVAALYLAASWFAIGGLICALAGRDAAGAAARFGTGGARAFGPLARLWLWSLVPYAVAAAAIAAGAIPPLVEPSAQPLAAIVLRAALRALPGAAAWLIVRAAADAARVRLALAPTTAAWRALAGGFAAVIRRPVAIAHLLLMQLVGAAALVAYIAATGGTSWTAAGGAIALFAARQAVSALRFAARATTLAGQLRLFGH